MGPAEQRFVLVLVLRFVFLSLTLLKPSSAENDDIDYVEYDKNRVHTFAAHLDPSRLSVPSYQNAFRQIIFLLFLGIYSQAVGAIPLATFSSMFASSEG